MRSRQLFSLLVSMLLLAGCSNLSVTTDFDAAARFTSWRTYSWKESPDTTGARDLLKSNPFVYQRVRSAVDRELSARGYALRERGAVDFTVSARGYVREMAVVEPDPAAWQFGYHRGRPGWYRVWWGSPWPNVVYYEEGTIVLDLTDASTSRLAWRGAVRGLVHNYRSPERMQQKIDEAVGKLLSNFPPGYVRK